MRKAAGLEGKMTYDPCISRQTPIYMKRPDVLKAIHADTHPNPNWPRDRPGWRYGKDVVYGSTALPQVNLSLHLSHPCKRALRFMVQGRQMIMAALCDRG